MLPHKKLILVVIAERKLLRSEI